MIRGHVEPFDLYDRLFIHRYPHQNEEEHVNVYDIQLEKKHLTKKLLPYCKNIFYSNRGHADPNALHNGMFIHRHRIDIFDIDEIQMGNPKSCCHIAKTILYYR